MTTTTLERPVSQAKFTRDQLTWFGYLLYGYWSYAWGLFGPVMPFLRDELKLNYGTAALHFSALALGPLMAGIVGYHVIRVLGPSRTIASGMLVIVLGVLAVLFGPNYYCTVFGAWLVGFGGSPAAQAIISCLADRFPVHRSRSIVELTISSAVFSALAPLTVAACIGLSLSWKVAMFMSIPVLLAISFLGKLDGSLRWNIDEINTAQKARLPKAYWLYFAVVFLSVAGEWSVCFWCTEYLERALHFSAANACAGLTAFLIAMFAGRLIGIRLTQSTATHGLLLLATALAATGFLVFWITKNPLVAIVGLVFAALGQANVYPLALSAAIGVTDGRPAKATSTMSLSTGSAIFLAPLALGLLADKIGMAQSYGIIAVFFALAAMMAGYAYSKNRGR